MHRDCVGCSDEGWLRVGDSLRELRRARALTQARLAQSAGMSTKHFGRIERGLVRPSRSAVVALARALAVSDHGRDLLLVRAGYATQDEGEAPAAVLTEGLARWVEVESQQALLVFSPAGRLVGQNALARDLLAHVFARPLPVGTRFGDPAIWHRLRELIVDFDAFAARALRRAVREHALRRSAAVSYPRLRALIADGTTECSPVADTPLFHFSACIDGEHVKLALILMTAGEPPLISSEAPTIVMLVAVDEAARRVLDGLRDESNVLDEQRDAMSCAAPTS
jgi:transcriptional regulator with XRE-family HTH domain